MFPHKYRYLFILGLSLFSFLNTVICEVYLYFHIEIEWYLALLTIFLITFFIWEGNRLAEPIFKKRLYNGKGPLRFLLVFFIAGNLISILVATAVVLSIGSLVLKYPMERNLEPLKLNVIYAGLINLFFHLLNAIFLFFEEYRKKLREAEELKRSSAISQLQLIKSQINPHFLFNSLNVLSGMVVKDNPEANKYIEEFSKVYRYILNNSDKELVTIQSELEFIQPYIFLLQKRFPEGLQVSINVPDMYKNYYIIPVALQMLVENAIKHNIVSRVKPLHIEMYVNGNQTIVVKNNYQPRQTSENSTLIGLQNISKRYELVSGKSVNVNSGTEHFEVVLPLLQLN
ncbi:MAG: histidine kinase [Chitinophagaceae bacterium]|nr:histidine kinase [Chitinophagaceae bacterium]